MSLKEDMISQLPDPLISHILNRLSTKEVVRTSVLSTTWRSLWLLVPRLDLNLRGFSSFKDFKRFGDRIFDSGRVLCIQNLKITIDKYKDKVDDRSYLTSWIDVAIKGRIQHLEVLCPQKASYYKIPQSFFVCETLVYLKLSWLTLVNTAEFVSLPCLKTMHLHNNSYPDEATFQTLVSCCPILEELKIVVVWNDAEVYRVHSRSLKRLMLTRVSSLRFDSDPGILIDAPLLCFLNVDDRVSKSFIVKNLESNAKLDISLFFGMVAFDEARRSIIHGIFPQISRIRDMTICADTLQLIYQYSKLEPLPQFGNMSRLCISLNASDFIWLPIFLKSCPNLKHLILGRLGFTCELRSEEMHRISFSYVPKCLLSSLEFVDIERPIRGYVAEFKLLRYFLENSIILKKLTLRLNHSSIKDNMSLKRLFYIPRASTECEVVIL